MSEKIATLENEKTEHEKINSALTKQLEEHKSSYYSVKKEQDDLLVLLSDQEEKLHLYKTKLKDLGAEVQKTFDICLKKF